MTGHLAEGVVKNLTGVSAPFVSSQMTQLSGHFNCVFEHKNAESRGWTFLGS